ncbi:MAG: O-antigen ligase family protein [Hamadaea sp.]|uniref:O-antigen ligase family protein n=1 Tax=Hamadaea sp. TaxID=2024425 RepID=UPI00181A42F3|nr:hypothetical protein [Hamadaea sp.]NUT22825.1 O-antigen ligase family protein [Hamadaea sp.]
MTQPGTLFLAKISSWWDGSLLRAMLLEPRQRLTTLLLAICVGAGPMALGNDDKRIYVGIAPDIPTVYTYTVVIAAIALIYTLQAPRQDWRGLIPWTPFFGWILLMSVFSWGFSARMSSGILHLTLGAVVFAIGIAAARRDPDGAVLPWAFAAVAWIQLLAIAFAAVGLPLRHITGPQAPDLVGRATGLTAHPGELAKVLFFCAMFALVLPRSTRSQLWASRLTLGAALLGISLSQSRTGLVGVLVLIVGFAGLEAVASGIRRTHLMMLGAAALLGLVSLPWLIARFSADPTGGARGHLLGVAARLIRDHWWSGLGPNNYVALGGAIDKLTSSGVPVHNALLLSTAELGVLGSMALWLPFVMVVVRAVSGVISSKGRDPAARVILASLPGLLLILLTGWGLLQAPVYLIFALAFGYLGARTQQTSEEVPNPHQGAAS